MTTLFTEIDLIRYLYGESSETEKNDIENAAACDADFGEALFSLKLDTSLLDKLSFSPSDFALERILSYSTSYAKDTD